MNENAKKVGLVLIIVLAVGAAAFSASKMFQGEKMESVGTIKVPEGFKSEKELALEAQKGGATPPPYNADRDLGGNLGSKGGAGGGGKFGN